MTRKLIFALVCIMAIAGFVGGCKPKSSVGAPPPGGYFNTQFQTESQFIVEAIVSDLAEQMYFASFHRLPDKESFSVVATEKGGSVDAPVYELQIHLDPKKSGLTMDLKIDGPIWSPEVYQHVAEELAHATGLKPGTSDKTDDSSFLSKFADSTAETIEQQNQELSEALESDFSNSELHEKAALLLGAFVLREHSGNFFEIRSPLSRITAHLAMARFLRGSDAFDVNGQMAETLLFTMINDQMSALELLSNMNTNDTAVVVMVRALRARNTGDYRPLAEAADRSPIESIQWFVASAGYMGMPMTWPKLTDEQKHTIDFVRAANEIGYSVEIGHELLEVSVPLEMKEIGSIYEQSQHKQLTSSNLAKVLNQFPEHCFSSEDGGKVHVHIIGWGQWAMFFQRHLCHAVQQNFYLMNSMWGVPDDAKAFAARCDESFGDLTLYPFVRRFNCTDIDSYHQSEDEGFKVTVATPQLVSAECWNYLCYKVNFAPLYIPSSNPHVNEWHNHNPPPGTVYDLYPRLNHPSLVGRGDVVERFEALRELAPYDCRLSDFISKKKYNGNPTYEQAMALYHDTLHYSVMSMRSVAYAAYGQPELYEDLMTKAAELDPKAYFTLGDYIWRMNNTTLEDKASVYYQKGYDLDLDRVGASYYAEWLVRHYLKRNMKDKAAEIANDAGMVYSFGGLTAQGVFFEETSNYDSAFEWFSKIEERYNDSHPLINFCIRYKAKTSDQRFDPEVQKRMDKLFPKGIEKVSLADFKGPPADGVLLQQQNKLMESAGLKMGDVIVAVYGIQVHNVEQYTYGRGLKTTPELDLIVWQGDAYREFTPSLPNHIFGVSLLNYPAK